MTSFADDVARQFADVREHLADSLSAVVLEIDDASRLVKVRVALDGEMFMPWIGARPWIGESVQVALLANQPYCLGASYGHPLGTVTLVGASVVSVLGDDGVTYVGYTFPYGLTLNAGWRVALDHKTRQVMHRLSTDPATPPTPPTPPTDPVTVIKTFNPTDSANFYKGSYSTAYVETSDNRAGFYYYGTQIADTIPDNATVNSASLHLHELWDQVPGTASRLGTHGATAVGSSAPGLSGRIDVTDGGDIDIKLFADALKTGAAYGVGFPAGYGWRRFDTASGSGAITITYTYQP